MVKPVDRFGNKISDQDRNYASFARAGKEGGDARAAGSDDDDFGR